MRAWLEKTITQAWTKKGVLACLLFPLSLLTAGLVRRRAKQLPQAVLPVPVIVVGNIFVGGTGKTPFTIWLVAALRQAGFHPGVISRGYGRSSDAVLPVSAASLARDVGDEPLLIAQQAQCPVYVGRKRILAAQTLLQAYPFVDVIISDDGLQHYALPRQIEIVLMDQRGHGNGWLLPAGPLREPVTRRRDFTVRNVGTLTAAQEYTALQAPASGQPFNMVLQCAQAYSLKHPHEVMSLSACAGKKVTAVAGIGHPERFFTTLKTAGVNCQTMAFPDHYAFREDDFLHISSDIILITEKDAVKCQSIESIHDDPRIWVVPVKAEVNHLLQQHIVEKLREFKIA